MRAPLILLSIVALVATHPLVTKFVQQNITVLDDVYSFAMFEVNFGDSNLSYFSTPGYCQPWDGTCTDIQSVGSPNPPNCQCDYTDTTYEFCSPTYNSSEHPCLCPAPDPGYCAIENDYGFITLLPGENYTFPNTDIIRINFHAYNPSCDSYVIRFSTDSFEPQEQQYCNPATFSSQIYVIPNPRVFMICPGENFWGKTVTFINPPYDLIGNTTIRLELRARPPPRPISPICTPPPELQGTHICIPTGQEMSFSNYSFVNETLIRFVVPVETNCNTLMWVSDTALIKLSLTDPWVWPTNSSNGIQTRQVDYQQIPGLFGYCFNGSSQYGTQNYIFGWANIKPTDTIFFDTAGEWVDARPISELVPIDYPTLLGGAVTLNCGTRSYTNWKHLPYLISSMEDGFANIRFVWPQDDPSPFFPALPLSTSWEYNGYTSPESLDLTPHPDRLAISVITSQRLSGVPSLTPKPLNYQFLTDEELDSCVVVFNGLILDSTGPISSFVTNISTDEVTCNTTKYHAYSEKASQMMQLSESYDPVINGIREQAILVYELDLLIATRTWNHCETYIKSLVDLNEYRLPILSNECTAEFDTAEFFSDPCCVIRVGTPEYNTDCVPVNTTVGQEEVTGFHPDFYQFNPDLPECAEQSVELFIAVLNKIKNPTIGCGTTYTDKNNYDKIRSRAFYSCWYPNFGLQAAFSGTPCLHDSECPDGPCMANSKTCGLNQTKQGLQFLQCVIQSFRPLDPFILYETCSALGVNCSTGNGTDEEIALNLFIALNVSSGCTMTPWFGWNSTGQQNPTSFYTPTEECMGTACPPLTSFWTLSEDETPVKWDCLFPSNQDCALVADDVVPETSCSVTRCNTDPQSYVGMCDGPATCCISDDGYECLNLEDYPPVNNTCLTTQFCILPNNTILPMDSATCASTMGCTVVNADTEEACNATGFCSDATDPIYGIFNPPYDTTDGACLVDIQYNSPFLLAPDLCQTPLRQTMLGCLDYNITQTQCEDSNFSLGHNPILYNSTKLRWIKKATNEAECQAYGKKCVGTPRATQYPSTFVDVMALPNPKDWASCLFTLTDLFTWTPGKWLPGQFRTISSTPRAPTAKRSTSPSFSRTPPVFDARKFYSLMQKNSDKHFSLILKSEVLCRFSDRKLHLDDLLCTQGFGCYQDVGFQAEQLAIACSEDTTTIDAYPLYITPSFNSLPVGECISFQLQTANIILFENNAVVQLSTILLAPTEDTAWAIRNPNGAIFGKVLTDGVIALFEGSFKNLTFCLPLSPSRLDYQNYTQYPKIDLATVDLRQDEDSRLLTPLNRTVIVSSSNFCAINVDLIPNRTYYFIQTIPTDPMAAIRHPWSPNELAYISVILALYCIGIIITLYGMIQRLKASNTFTEVLLIFFILTCFFIFRIVLFAIALADPDSLSKPVVGYLLVEFPILLFFCFVSLFIITWSIVIRSTHVLASISGDKWIKLCRTLAITFITIVFMTFILMIILYEELIPAPAMVCRSTVLIFDSEEAFILLMSYRSIFSTLAFILGICLAIVGSMIITVMRNKELEVPRATQFKVISATLFGTFGLFAQAIYYLVITATQGYHQSTFLSLSILLIDEVLPALFFLGCVVTLPNPKRLLSSGKTKTKSRFSTPPKSTHSGASTGNKASAPNTQASVVS